LLISPHKLIFQYQEKLANQLAQFYGFRSPVINRCILTAAVGVNNRPFADQAVPPGLQKNVDYQLRRHSLRDFPTDNAAREFILKARQITKAAAPQPQISNVADKNFTFIKWRVCRVLQKICADCQAVI
jgi:hypothetical protein